MIESLGTGTISISSFISSGRYSSIGLFALLLKQITSMIITITAAPTPIAMNIAMFRVLESIDYSLFDDGGSSRESVVYDVTIAYPTTACIELAYDPFCINRFICC
jgi:hypothetical protein